MWLFAQFKIDVVEIPLAHPSGTCSAGRQMLEVTVCSTTFGDRSFTAAAPQVWNSLPDSVRDFSLCKDTFAKRLKSHLIV